MSELEPNVVVVGGGTGSFTLLQELKLLTPNLTAVVNMCDDGGSTGMLRDELGVLPPGDVRQCLVALSETPKMRDVFNYRFSEGSFKNQSLGNIILAGLEKQHGNFAEAVEVASELLNIHGRVVPVSLENYKLVMHDGDQTLSGQSVIDKHAITSDNPRVELDPPAQISDKASQAFIEAEMIVIAPGNLYSSLVPTLAVGGVAEAIKASKATKVMVTNLVNKPGQTDGWSAADYAITVERYVGKGQLDYILYNNAPPDALLLAKYAADGEFPLEANEAALSVLRAQAIGASLVAQEIFAPDPNDTILRRTLIRHNAVLVRELLQSLLPWQRIVP
ncbi:MAG: hypothetical protein JWO41_186 [Candidatus Saccharibacteria bacterium]|nr:hypothetical protein [Candidatus Saccharibacteria bacterium]